MSVSFRQLQSWILLEKDRRLFEWIKLLENVLTDMEEETPFMQSCRIRVLGDEMFCAKFIRRLALVEDPAIQYLMLEMIINCIELCRTGKDLILDVGAR